MDVWCAVRTGSERDSIAIAEEDGMLLATCQRMPARTTTFEQARVLTSAERCEDEQPFYDTHLTVIARDGAIFLAIFAAEHAHRSYIQRRMR
jgi:hypothetical protein